MMQCPICKSNKDSKYLCDYKFEIHEDKKYFGNLKFSQSEFENIEIKQNLKKFIERKNYP